MPQRHDNPLGAYWLGEGRARFNVWAPAANTLDVHLCQSNRYIALEKDTQGYFCGIVDGVQIGDLYVYRIDGDKERPDPASRAQPDGVHAPSQIVDPNFDWDDAAFSPPTLRNSVFYELHVGTFSEGGTFAGLLPHLQRLKELGITTLSLMPIAQFPGDRNWGYDGVQLYAPQSSYGTPQMLKTLINQAHQVGLAVYLDVVYNHLGPEGNYLWDYGPYFTQRYASPWSDSLNFDGEHSDHVRRFFIENAIYWLDEFHFDGLRLDATHALFDFSAKPFLEDLTEQVHIWAEQANRRVYLIAENDQSDRKLVLTRREGGYGLDGQWLDDFHHAVHNALTGETDGYYADYGDFKLLTKVLRERFAYTGQYSPHRKRRHGTPAADIPADRYVVATQNHDQVGNRMLGERLIALTDFDSAKLAAGLLLTSPYVPMLFMGQEYAERAPFQFFTSFGDDDLIEAVRKGRAEEFAAFKWQGEAPDPHSEATFQRSKLDHTLRHEGHHAQMYALYQDLLKLRHTYSAFTNPKPEHSTIYADEASRIFCMERYADSGELILRLVYNWDLEQAHTLQLEDADMAWRKLLDSNAPAYCKDAEPRKTAPDNLPAADAAILLPPKSFAIYISTPDTN